MAISSYQVLLMHKVSSAYQLLVKIKDYPDLGGAPDMLETTTTSDPAQTFILGIQSVNPLEFTANYNDTDFDTLKGMAGTDKDFAVWLGETGANGKFEFSGTLDVHVVGGGVNEVVDMLITIAPSSAIEKN